MNKKVYRASIFVALCACIIGLFSVASSAGIPDSAKALAALDEEWSKAAASGDADKVVSFYADDAVVYPPNAPMMSDRAAIKQAWTQMLSDHKVKLSWKTENAAVDHNTGITSGPYQVTGADGAVVEKGKYLCVWSKGKDGKWKAIHDMWNTDTK